METLPLTEKFLDHVKSVAAAALAAGALEPVLTDKQTVALDGIPYLFHILRGRDKKLENLVSQKKDQTKAGEKANPFLPYDPRMEIALLSDSHACLLNKFPVLENHLLIVTRYWEHQDRVLHHHDFHAACLLLERMQGLAFYNGGKPAGASQRHKHLQVVPLPMTPTTRLPFDPFITQTTVAGRLGRVPQFPFAHAFAPLPNGIWQDPLSMATLALGLYRAMLRSLALGDGLADPGPYNLLLTREWLMIVPRAREYYQGIGLNSLGFTGSIFLKDAQQLEQVIQMGPLALLRGVGFPL